MKLFTVFFVTIASAALKDNELIHDSSGVLNEQIVSDSELQEQSAMKTVQERYVVDASGAIVNETEIPRIIDMQSVPYQKSSRQGYKKKCRQSSPCVDAGGFCFKNKTDCASLVDFSLCRGKRCSCCLPVTESFSNITWYRVGADRFFYVEEKMNFTNAQMNCKSFGETIELYQPRDSTLVSKFMQQEFKRTYQWTWLGGRGNGTDSIWLPSGDVMTAELPWVNTSGNPNMENFATSSCVWLISNYGWEGGVLNNQNKSCSRSNDFHSLCG